jgi:hypothetical protein
MEFLGWITLSTLDRIPWSFAMPLFTLPGSNLYKLLQLQN